MKKLLLTGIMMILITGLSGLNSVFAQNHRIDGTVVDETGIPVIGAVSQMKMK